MTGKLLLSALLLCFAPAAFAQMTAEVQFQSGNYGTMVNGAVTGDEYFDYVLGCKSRSGDVCRPSGQ